MDRVKRMQPVLRLAEIELDKIGRQLLLIQQRIETEQQKIQQLQDYQQEYRLHLQTAAQSGITIDRLRIYDGFHQQLDRAIVQQQQLILQIQQDHQAVRALWQQKDIRFKSLQKMIEKLQREASVVQNRNEQRNHDEYARRRVKGNIWS